MPNLSRYKNQYFLPSVAAGTAEVEAITTDMYGVGRKVFLLKSAGVTIPGNLAGDADPKPMVVNIMPGKAGVKGVKTISLRAMYNPNITEYDFRIKIVRRAKVNGHQGELLDIPHTYNYLKKNFHTSAAGAFDDTDIADILSTLAARINQDVQLGYEMDKTGAVVVATYVAAVGADPGPEMEAYIKLEAKDASVAFDVNIDINFFEIDAITGVLVAQVKPIGTAEDVAKLFSIKPEDAGTMKAQPTKGVLYTKIEVIQRSIGADNHVASGTIGQEQRFVIWVPNADADALTDVIVVALKAVALKVYKNGVEWTA